VATFAVVLSSRKSEKHLSIGAIQMTRQTENLKSIALFPLRDPGVECPI